MHSPWTHCCSLSSPGPHLGLLGAGATFRCKDCVQSCFPAFHLCHKQGCTVVKGSTFCYRMALFLFHCLHYWGKGLWKRCACRSLGTQFCQAWEWSDFIIKVFPGLTNCQVKFYSSWRKSYKTIITVPSGCSRIFFPCALTSYLFDPSNFMSFQRRIGLSESMPLKLTLRWMCKN